MSKNHTNKPAIGLCCCRIPSQWNVNCLDARYSIMEGREGKGREGKGRADKD